MIRKLFAGLMIRSDRTTRHITAIKIGRMSAETTDKVVKEEFTRELKQMGWEKITEKMAMETAALEELTYQRDQIKQQVTRECIIPTITRAQNGYGIKGLFWQNTQETKDQIISVEDLIANEEQIDWLTTRRKFFRELNNKNETYYSIEAQRVCDF